MKSPRGIAQIPLIIILAILGFGAIGGGGYVAVNTLVDQKVAKIQEEISQNQIEEVKSEMTASDSSEQNEEQKTAPKESESVVDKTSASTPTKTEPKVEEKKSEIKTFTTPSGAVIDEAGNIISGPTQSAPAAPTTNLTPGAKILSGEEVYSLISPSIVLIESSEGHGTGFVVEGGKYTITNAHVVGADKEVSLTFQGGGKTSGAVLGKNESSDVALIYNNNISPKPVKLGSSTAGALKTGAEVYALGFPLSFTSTVTLTKGLVSANRQQTSLGTFIQTDANIHPGNSGGPLVNNKGEVVGINTLVVGAQGNVSSIGGTGIGFAIPIETATALIPSLSQYGQTRYETYPVGSTISIKRTLIFQMALNDELSCSDLNYKENDLTLCNLYRNHYDDYTWNIIEDL